MGDKRNGEEISYSSQGVQVKKRKTSNAENSNVANGMGSGRNLSALALSHYPVLRNVFRMMDEEDLEIARKVCTSWRDVAHLMMPGDYQIHLGPPYYDSEYYEARRHDWVLVKKRDRHNPQSVTHFETNSSDLLLLNEDLQSRKVSISLNIDREIHIRGPRLKIFLSRFGNLVVELDYFCSAHLLFDRFCKVLLEDLPNLEYLNFSPRFQEKNLGTVPDINPEQAQNTHKHLKRITLGRETSCSFQSLGRILQLAPNLEEIHNLPIWLINAAVEAKKGPALKSVIYNYDDNLDYHAQNELTIMSAFEKLAQLKPKLTTFCVLPNESSFEKGTSVEMIKPFVSSILQSSVDSLHSFEIRVSDWSIFRNCVPRLYGVKTLVFDAPSACFEKKGSSLPQISLQKKFPNVIEMQIRFDLNEKFMNRYLPKSVLSPWGCQIKTLYVLGHLPPSSVPFLRVIFPDIEHLRFSGTSKQTAELLPALAEYWGAKLKSLTVLLARGLDGMDKNIGILDCAFTGLSLRDVNKLLDPYERFTDAEIQSFKKKSSITKLTELKQLTINLVNREGLNTEFIGFTHVSNDFAFKLLPNLKVTVEIWKNCKLWTAVEIPAGPRVQRAAAVSDGSQSFYPRGGRSNQ